MQFDDVTLKAVKRRLETANIILDRITKRVSENKALTEHIKIQVCQVRVLNTLLYG
ncbi:hypothetical protein ACJMK2_014598, partial [Sinanodonta woodiana]